MKVAEAAGTKWNFRPFRPGLVGGHCIGVDPYYLAHCAQTYGYYPEIILAATRINDGMGEYVATETIKLMLEKDIQVLNSNILILGFTFKENCPDVHNTKVIDIKVVNELPNQKFDAFVAAVAHKKFEGLNICGLLKPQHVVFDVKCTLDRNIVDGRL